MYATYKGLCFYIYICFILVRGSPSPLPRPLPLFLSRLSGNSLKLLLTFSCYLRNDLLLSALPKESDKYFKIFFHMFDFITKLQPFSINIHNSKVGYNANGSYKFHMAAYKIEIQMYQSVFNVST